MLEELLNRKVIAFNRGWRSPRHITRGTLRYDKFTGQYYVDGHRDDESPLLAPWEYPVEEQFDVVIPDASR